MTSVTRPEATGILAALSAGTALAALVGTALYYQQAPDGQALPYLVFSQQAGAQENITAADLHNDLWFVRAYAVTAETAAAIDEAADAQLDGQALAIAGFNNFWTARETDLSVVENTPSGKIFMQGALYRLRIDN